MARFEVPAGLEAVLLVPDEAVRTREARRALPATVPHADAAANAAYAATLALGLAIGDWELVRRGLHDRIHQSYRASLFPKSSALLARAEELGALGATVSGAGPTVLFWSHYELTAGLVERLSREAAGWATVQRVPFEPMGADVRASVALRPEPHRRPQRHGEDEPADVAAVRAQAAEARGVADARLVRGAVDRQAVAAAPALRRVGLVAGQRQRAAAVGAVAGGT